MSPIPLVMFYDHMDGLVWVDVRPWLEYYYGALS
jgi:hypothetical protein